MKVTWSLGAAMVFAATTASAQTVVTSITDPIPGWGRYNRFLGSETIRGTQAIDGTYSRGANPGSIRFSGDAGVSGGLRHRVAYVSTRPLGLLSALESTGFDWFRSSTSTTGGIQAPALRLFVASENRATLSELIWEYTYNGPGNAPTDGWQSVNSTLTTGSWWRFSNGQQQACGADFYTVLGNWSSCLGQDAEVYGISVGLGSLPDAGSFDGAVDLPRLKFAGADEMSWDFGTGTVVPEPSTYALMAAGLAGLFAVQRRRRVKA